MNDDGYRIRKSAYSHDAIGKYRIAYSIAEAVILLSISRTTLYACIKSGELRAIKLGRKTLIRAQDINAFLDRLQREGA